MTSNQVSNHRLLTFTSGGWVLLLAGLVSLALFVWAVWPALLRTANRPPGDGKNIESYAFDLSNLQVPRELIVPATLYRDMVPVMTDPTASDPETAQTLNDPRGKYLVPGDAVIGVEINGEARAYPLSVMYVHEIINDTLGGVPIAVTYHWPSDGLAVFDRRLGDRVLEFGMSGLVYNSTQLLYDRNEHRTAAAADSTDAADGADSASASDADASKPVGGEALWCQLLGRSITGPNAGTQLTIIPSQRTTWATWLETHPETTVVNRNKAFARRYKHAAPKPYMNSNELIYPVDPMPPAEGPSAKTPVLVVIANAKRRVYALPFLITQIEQAGTWSDTVGGVEFTFDSADVKSQTVRVQAADADQSEDIATLHAYWFAWHALYPEDEVVWQTQSQQTDDVALVQ